MTILKTWPVTSDTYADENSPRQHYGSKPYLQLRDAANHTRYVYLHVGHPPKGATILSAILVMTLKGAWAGTTEVEVKRIVDRWAEKTLAWQGKPAVGGAAFTENVVGGTDSDTVEVDITALVQLATDGSPYNGLRVAVDSATLVQLYSSEAQATEKQPYLQVEYAMPPDPPKNLRPSGVRDYSTDSPLLLWDSDTPTFSRVIADKQQADVGVDDDGTLTGSPFYDSGVVANVTTEWDLEGTAFDAYLASGESAWWRVRIQDENGINSDWSDAATFGYRALGTLTIDSPASNGDTVLTTTPLIEWTLGVTTQAFIELFLYEGTTEVYHLTRRAYLDPDFELPAGLVRLASPSTYTVKLRVWDTFDREGTGSALSYLEASRSFVLEPSTVDPVTTVTVAQEDGHLLIHWERAVAPDYFALKVGDTFIFDRLLPADYTVGGTAYEIKYWRADLHEDTTYEVYAVEDNAGVFEMSDGNDTADFTWSPVGVWLIDEESEFECFIADRRTFGTSRGQDGETYFPLGGTDAIRIVDSVRGLEGTLGGFIMQTAIQDLDDALEAFNYIADHSPRGEARIIYGARNLPVILGEVGFDLAPNPEEMYNVTVDFWQRSE